MRFIVMVKATKVSLEAQIVDARAFVDQGDLTKVVRRLHGGASPASNKNSRLTGFDQEEGVTGRALLNDCFPLRETMLLEQARDLLNLVFVQISEEWRTQDGFNGDVSRSA
jgi:hypothetical protein